MGFVAGYDHDVFVSYAHADEDVDASGTWITQFVDALKRALKARLGGADDLNIFFDNTSLRGNQQLAEMLTEARRSAVFLAIASRSYAKREWTQEELRAFIRAPQDTARLFAAECLPLDNSEAYPAPLQEHKRTQFWRIDQGKTPMALSVSLDAEAFRRRIHDLAEEIRNQLVKMRAAPAVARKGAAPLSAAPPEAGRTEPSLPSKYCEVLLAQVTDDLDDERDQLRRYLEQFGVTVLPAENYPQGGEAFKTAVAADLAQTGLFVQLLSKTAGRAPPDLPEGYARCQYEAASAQRIKMALWRRPDLDLESVTNPRHSALLSADTVIAVGFENFKAEVLRLAELPTAAPAPKASRAAMVFIDADKDDTGIAQTLYQEFKRNNVPANFLTVDAEQLPDAVREELEENIVECDALVVVYGETEPRWVRGQLRLYNKLKAKRAKPARILAVYSGPPENKGELNFFLPEMREIDCRKGVTVEPVRALIAELEN